MKAKTRLALKILVGILLLASLLSIYLFSSQSGEISSNTSGKVTRFILRIFVPNFSSLPQEEQATYIANYSTLVRKLAHFTEFCFLSILVSFELFLFQIKYYYFISLGVGLFSAIFDEFHQKFVSGRGPGILDVGIDFLGVLFGASLILLLIYITTKIKEKKVYYHESIS